VFSVGLGCPEAQAAVQADTVTAKKWHGQRMSEHTCLPGGTSPPARNDIPEDSNHFTQVAIAQGRFNTRRKFSSNAGVVAAEDLTSHGPEVNWDVISTF